MSATGTRVKDSGKSLHERTIECRENGYLLSGKKIGTGAFSKVYLGYATPNKISKNYKLANDLRSKNHNMVAIKIISVNEAPLEYSKKFLHREIYALNATYRHPGVVQLYDMFRSLKRFYLILELALSGDLLEHINAVSHSKGSPGLSEEEARRLFKQIVNAVMHCHNNHIVHRDLKCENILLDEQGFVKLTDFGFANHYTDRSALMNTFCGSVAYTAPEILLSRKYNGEQADLWSLGVILYAMVTGKLPYHEKHPRKLVQLIRKELPFHHPVSSGCQDLIKKLLEWQPAARLPLDQVNTHQWMMPSMTGLLYKLRATRSDITHKNKALDKKLKDGRSCHSGPGTPTRSSFRHTSLPERPQQTIVAPHYRPGASSAGCHRREPPQEKREEPPCPKPPLVSPCRLLMRPTQSQSTNTNRLFVTRPRPPFAPKPFHNLPNFRKPGSANRQLHSPSGKLTAAAPPTTF
ncbi:testis-specific serine/threonine-protein kinase 5-like [Salvelinus namaycush]|uniref:non-specific serine/threonine protein kinase n=1 Tax=Salvelinus namaycush TaxID=8040 RepID=A0A8U0TU28_SALNM|nr:testis-specific serine/threonine-protein kinase 5-like [Salvelinus namaycush]